MKDFFKLIYVLILLLMIVSCGGGSSSSGNNSSVESDGTFTDKLALSRLKGVWKGSLTIYLDGRSQRQCEWDITVNFTSTKITDSHKLEGGIFLGEGSAELLYAIGDNKNKCISDTVSLDWSAICYGDKFMKLSTLVKNENLSCLLDFDDPRTRSSYLFNYTSLRYILDSSHLSYDKKHIIRKRTNRDDPKLDLIRAN